MTALTNDTTTDVLTLLETGSRIDSAHLKELERTLAVSLRSGRQFGTPQRLPGTWATDWQHQWDNVDKILDRTRVLLNEMIAGAKSNEADHLQRAMIAWEAIQREGDQLQTALGHIRALASSLAAEDRKRWNLLALTLETELEAIHTCAQALRIKLELLKRYSLEEAEHLVHCVTSKLPKRDRTQDVDPALYDHELSKAVIELEKEQHESSSFMDIVKAMLIWVETPEERMRKNRSLQVDLA